MLGHTFLFAGPTLTRARKMTELDLAGVEILPPVARGDVAALVARKPAGTIVLVDGVFHKRLAVGHAEIRDAIAAGWTIWGVSSMGAIRAREMANLGVRGFGAVYEAFCVPGRDLRDDEVTLLHGPGPDYVELSEPLFHLRAALEAFVARGDLRSIDEAAITDTLAKCYFGDRTLLHFATLVASRNRGFDPLIEFDEYRVKSLDLIRFAEAVLVSSGGGKR